MAYERGSLRGRKRRELFVAGCRVIVGDTTGEDRNEEKVHQEGGREEEKEERDY